MCHCIQRVNVWFALAKTNTSYAARQIVDFHGGNVQLFKNYRDKYKFLEGLWQNTALLVMLCHPRLLKRCYLLWLTLQKTQRKPTLGRCRWFYLFSL